jgi:hypothetical protein
MADGQILTNLDLKAVRSKTRERTKRRDTRIKLPDLAEGMDFSRGEGELYFVEKDSEGRTASRESLWNSSSAR